MRMFNNYSNSYNFTNHMSEIRGLSNDYGLNLNGIKKEYNEEKIAKLNCNHHKIERKKETK